MAWCSVTEWAINDIRCKIRNFGVNRGYRISITERVHYKVYIHAKSEDSIVVIHTKSMCETARQMKKEKKQERKKEK